ncbi:hypothetical protein COX87_01985 [bacterium (Candidatus Moisslbacteria) CG_4_10_14_0_2_um_filter_36_61]|nr:MAG: hypothetical protein COX87_01985 [bacterium (Candidatus Moisslbacteria) CG_4_10_14_0_2_um_filter_36_61]
MKLEVIMFNMSNFSDWEKGIVNRNRHIFYTLRKNPNIQRLVAIDFLPFTLKRAVKNFYGSILRRPKPGSEVIHQDLTSRCIKLPSEGPPETYVYSSIDSFFSSQLFFKKLNHILEKISGEGERKDLLHRVVWSYFPMFVDYFNTLQADSYVFDAVDNWLEHTSFSQYKKKLERNYKIIGAKSDLIFAVAPNLIEFFRSFGREKNVYAIENGVDFDHFNKEINYKDKRFEKLKRPIVGYVGTIEERIDADLLAYLASQNQDKSFALIGPVWPNFRKEAKKFKIFKNVYLFDRCPYEASPYYIQKFDVAIIPHKMNKFMKYTSSLKLLEYLACGKPAVTIPASGAEKVGPLVYLASGYAEFNKRINQALVENNPELVEKRKEYAQSESWEKKTEEMLKLLNF